MIKAVIFDMDGVLVEAQEWHYEALNKALSLFGFIIERESHLTIYNGLPTKRKLEMLSAEFSLPNKLHKFIDEMKQIYTIKIVNERCRPRFEHEYALSKLKNEGYRLALASNSIKPSIDLMMAKTSLDQYLEFTLSADDVKKAKPHPDIYQLAIAKLGLMPNECLVIEDNDKGVLAAKNAGAYVMQVSDVGDVNYANIKNEINRIG